MSAFTRFILKSSKTAGRATKLQARKLSSSLPQSFLELEQIDINLFRSGEGSLSGFVPQPGLVYGGAVLGQSLAAAALTLDPSFLPHSLHCCFIKAGRVDKRILYFVDRVRDGGSISNRSVRAVQDGQNLCSIQISFCKEEGESVSHQDPMPEVPDPDTLPDSQSLIAQLTKTSILSGPIKKFMERRIKELPPTFELRPVDPMAFLFQPEEQPRLLVWLKSKDPIESGHVIEEQCMAAYISDSLLLPAAVSKHVTGGFLPGMLFSLDHSIWFHRAQFAMDDWMLFETTSPVACASRALVHGKMWSKKDGLLVISASQEGLIRA